MSQFNQRRDGWTAEITAELHRLAIACVTPKQAAEALGSTRDAVARKALREGLTLTAKRQPYSAEQMTLFEELWTKTDKAAADIIAAVNAIGPKRFTHGQLLEMAKYYRFHRPPSWSGVNGKRSAQIRGGWANAVGATSKNLRGAPIPIPYREVRRLGADLELPLSKRGDIYAVSNAMKRAQPGHPGFVLADHQPTRLTWAR